MKLRTNYHRDTGIISLSWAHRESERCAAWCSSHNTGWEMPVEQWIELLGLLRVRIDEVQACEARENQRRQEFADQLAADLAAEIAKGRAADDELAAKIAEHGGAS